MRMREKQVRVMGDLLFALSPVLKNRARGFFLRDAAPTENEKTRLRQSLERMEMTALRAPRAEGSKETLKMLDAPGARLEAGRRVTVKSDPSAPETTTRAELVSRRVPKPPLVMVKVRWMRVVPVA